MLTNFQLQTTLAASKSALCAAEVAKAEASVEMSRALYIRQHAEREVAETRKINDKVLTCALFLVASTLGNSFLSL